MEKLNIKEFNLNQTQLNQTEEILNQILQHPKIVEFIREHKLSEEYVRSHISSLSFYYDELVECDKCKSIETCTKGTKGYYTGLKFDGYIFKVVKKCKKALEQDDKYKHMKQYIQNDLPKEMFAIKFTDIDVKNETVEYNKHVMELVKWCKDPTSKGFYITGGVGVGKTYLISCLANQCAINGRKISFVHMPTFMNRLKSFMTSTEDFEKEIYRMKNVPVLILDDIGAENITKWGRDEILLMILNYRFDAKKVTFFTSNYSLKELEIQYMYANKQDRDELPAKRIVSRIQAMVHVLELKGKNRRNTD